MKKILIAMLGLIVLFSSVALSKNIWVPINLGDITTFIKNKPTNTISTINALVTNNTLTFKITGNFESNSHYLIYIDSDNNPNTGYSRNQDNIKGADYLLQGHTLYKYKGPDFKWDRIGDVRFHTTSTETTLSIDKDTLPLDATIKYTAVVSSHDWKTNYSFGKMKELNSDNTLSIKTLNAVYDNGELTFNTTGKFSSNSHVTFYIDADNNPDTGYSRGQIKGADYLVEDSKHLYAYPKGATGWKWDKVSDNVSGAINKDSASAIIELSDIHDPNHINYIASISSHDWKKKALYKEMKSMDIDGQTNLTLASPHFIPAHGSPAFSWNNAPANTKSYVLIIDDHSARDNKGNHWVHWVLFDMGKNTKHIDAGKQPQNSEVGKNSFDAYEYGDPRYPNTHDYRAHLYALDIDSVSEVAGYSSDTIYDANRFESLMKGHILQKSEASSNHEPDDNQLISFNENSNDVKNPERGLYANHYLVSSPYRSYNSTKGGRYKWIVDGGYKVFVEKLVLVDFRDKPISDEYLEEVRKDFSFARANGLKMIVRATYNEHQGDPDAPLDVVLNHINQLQPIYHEYEDVIFSVEAGFIGAWGEWHSSSNDLNHNNQAKDAIKDALLAAIPSSISVQFRNPTEIIRWYPTPLSSNDAYSWSDQSRVGLYDDCFNWDKTDMGTFTGDDSSIKSQKEYIKQSSRFTPIVGETCPADITTLGGSTASCEGVIKLAEDMHLTSLGDNPWNANYTRPIDVYKRDGCWDEIVRRLGYRFVLKHANLPKSVKSRTHFLGEIKIQNDGFASLTNKRDAYIVLENGSKRYEFKIDSDPRRWEAGKLTTVSFDFTLPNDMVAGNYKVSLWLPDNHDSLKNDVKNAIQTANIGTWDTEKGYNVLGSVKIIARG